MSTRRRTGLRRYGMSITDRLITGAARSRDARAMRAAVYRVPATPPSVPAALRALMPLAAARSARYQSGSAREVKCYDCAPVQPAAGISWILPNALSGDPTAAFVGITCLNLVPQGAGVFQRVGNKIFTRNIRLRAYFSAATAADLVYLRVAVIYDRQPNGAYPAIADIFANATTGACTQMVSLNIANVRRFTPLRDQILTVDPAKSVMPVIDWYIPCRLQTEFKTSTSAIADITTGSILLVVSAVNGAGSLSTFATGGLVSRIRYDDS